MRVILVAFMVSFLVALPAIPAQAQQSVEQLRSKSKAQAEKPVSPQQKIKKAREEERAAKSAIEMLPDKPYDPWRNVR